MIQPQEIRIANYIEYNGEIIKLDGSLLCCYIQNELEFPLNPIPLTEEILLKFGFEKRDKINPPFRNYQYVFMKNGFLIGSDFLFHYISGNTELKHVHQLQNLYFALTGEELTFKKD